MRGEAKQRVLREGRPVAVEHYRQAAAARRLADRLDEFRIAVVGQHGIRGATGVGSAGAVAAIRSSR